MMYITLMIVFDVLFLICLAICAVTDRQYQIIPNHTILFMAALAFGRAALLMSQGQLMWPGLSILLLIVPLYLSWIKGGIGGGDVKMISAIMLYLGLTATIISLAISILIISIQRFVRPGRMLRRDLPRKRPLAPALALGCCGGFVFQYIAAFMA